MIFPNKTRGATFAWIAAALYCAFLPAVSHATLIWDSNFGTQLTYGSFSSSGLQSVPLGFTLPFENNTYTSVYVSTAGFIWLGGINGDQCCVVDNESDAVTYFNGSPPRIAPAWYDLLPTGGGIYFSSFLDADGITSEAVITFDDVPSATNDLATFQVQLYSTGMIVFSYMDLDQTSLGPNPGTLIGLTAGNGSSASSVDLLNVAAGNPTTTVYTNIYDYLASSPNFSLSNQSLVFTPTGTGWQIGTSIPAPEPATLFTGGGAFLLIAAIFYKQRRTASTKL